MFSAHTQWVDAPRQVSPGTVLFAIGDTHGHAKELAVLQQVMIEAAAEKHRRRVVFVHLGDYIDRGPEIRRTLEILLEASRRQDGIDRVFLVGNHDQFLIELLALDSSLNKEFIAHWYNNGGESTMQSLGVDAYGRLLDSGNLRELSARTEQALGDDLVSFLRNLKSLHREGAYVFVHAGIAPESALEAQEFADLVLIREPFLQGKGWRHDFCVVHGHSIAIPTVLPHRISVDAGCFAFGALCAVQIEDDRLRFLGVTRLPEFPWQQKLGGRRGEWNWSAPTPR